MRSLGRTASADSDISEWQIYAIAFTPLTDRLVILFTSRHQ